MKILSSTHLRELGFDNYPRERLHVFFRKNPNDYCIHSPRAKCLHLVVEVDAKPVQDRDAILVG